MRSNCVRDHFCACFGSPSKSNCGLVPLCEIQTGKTVKVASVGGERRVCARMAALGIYPGVEMHLLRSGGVRVNGGVLCLSEDISGKIFVIPS